MAGYTRKRHTIGNYPDKWGTAVHQQQMSGYFASCALLANQGSPTHCWCLGHASTSCLLRYAHTLSTSTPQNTGRTTHTMQIFDLSFTDNVCQQLMLGTLDSQKVPLYFIGRRSLRNSVCGQMYETIRAWVQSNKGIWSSSASLTLHNVVSLSNGAQGCWFFSPFFLLLIGYLQRSQSNQHTKCYVLDEMLSQLIAKWCLFHT